MVCGLTTLERNTDGHNYRLPPHAGSQNCMNVGQMVNYVKNVKWQTVKYKATNYVQKDTLSQNKVVVERVHII